MKVIEEFFYEIHKYVCDCVFFKMWVFKGIVMLDFTFSYFNLR